MLNLVQHLTNVKTLEPLKQVQGDSLKKSQICWAKILLDSITSLPPILHVKKARD